MRLQSANLARACAAPPAADLGFTTFRGVFWLRVLAIGQIALVVRRHLMLLEPDERGRLAKLVGQSRGRPTKNLSANEREELLRLVRKLEPRQFGMSAFNAARRAPWRKP
jgi:hypothetical protein